MHLIPKVYSRCFQTAFKLAIPLLPYRNPEILDHVNQIPPLLKEKGIFRVLVITDPFLRRSGALEPMRSALNRAGIQCVVYDEATPNPTVENVESARQLYIQHHCSALIGFGGGSSIDCAKAVGARIVRPRKSVAKMRGILKIRKKLPFLIAVPTTAGTGSETTVTTVITDSATAHKFPISDFPLIPRVAVLDPENTRTLPPHLTATTGMDALTHAIEAYIGRSTVKSTRSDALTAAMLVSGNIQAAFQDGNNMTARKNMLTAAHLAGRAFSKSYVGYCHAIAHALGGMYHIPHGLANAVLLPYVLESYGNTIYNKSKDIAMAMGIAEEDTPPARATDTLIRKLRQMNREMGIPEKLSGIHPEDIPKICRIAAREANPLYPVPRLMDALELERIVYHVMEEHTNE